MELNKHNAIAIFTVELIIAAALVQTCLGIEPAQANGAINQAELSLTSTFAAVAEADNAGADVTELLSKLSTAGDLLSQANTAFRAGNYETANSLAEESKNALEGVATEAGQLEADAQKAKTNILFLTIEGSSVGLVLLAVISIIGWWLLRKRYTDELHN